MNLNKWQWVGSGSFTTLTVGLLFFLVSAEFVFAGSECDDLKGKNEIKVRKDNGTISGVVAYKLVYQALRDEVLADLGSRFSKKSSRCMVLNNMRAQLDHAQVGNNKTRAVESIQESGCKKLGMAKHGYEQGPWTRLPYPGGYRLVNVKAFGSLGEKKAGEELFKFVVRKMDKMCSNILEVNL